MDQPETFTATLKFLAPSDTPPVYRASQGGADAQLDLEGDYAEHRVEIANGRLIEGLSFERDGFYLMVQKSGIGDFYDDSQVEDLYSREVEALVKQVTGASNTRCFDHTRRAASSQARGRHGTREPSAVVHNDYTDKSGPQRVRDMMGEEAEALLARRFAIVNVWRPIRHPAETSLLALCRANSARPCDLIATPRIAKDRIGELMLAHHHPDQSWVTFPAMTPDEVLLLKTYDSEADGRARFAIHTAFDNPSAPAAAKPRESIESRVFAFF
ncbi:CmcJ/NvfI family oxidoreductase [Limibacillus halophilus]